VALSLRILLVVDSLEVGGAERHVADLATALQAAGHLAVVACAAGGPLADELRAENIPVRVLTGRNVKRRVGLNFAWKLRRLLRKEEFDLIHAHLYAAGIASTLATVHTACARVVTVHSEGVWQGRVARTISGRVYRAADAVVAVSDPIAVQLRLRHRVELQRTVVIPNGLYRPIPSQYQPDRASSRRGLVIGVVSRLCRDKGVDVLLEAMVWVRCRHPDVRTVVVGDGPDRESLQQRARELGLRGRITFLGCVPAARSLLSSLDLLVVPSRTEGSPLIVLEAMNAGVPVIASRVGGIPHQIRHGVDGLLVPAENPRALADAIDRLIRNPSLTSALATAGKRRVTASFSYQDMLDGISRVYAEAQTIAHLRHGGGTP
jgi:glycosyltransferase involved in cell wall biosynthesis